MEVKGLQWLPVSAVSAVLLLSITAGCRQRQNFPDASKMFKPSGEEMVRELGIYAGETRVGDLSMGRLTGKWQGEAALQLSERVNLRLSFRSDRFSITSSQISWVDEGMGLLASDATLDFSAGSWETRVMRDPDGSFVREQVTGGSRSRDRLKVPEGALISDALPLYLERVPFREGEKRDLKVYNMTLGQEFPLTLRYIGPAGKDRLFAATYWGMEEKIRIDAAGMVVQEDMALGVSARAADGKGLSGYLPMERVLARTSVPGLNIPADLAERKKAVVVLQGSPSVPVEGTWQSVRTGEDESVVTLRKPVIPSADRRRIDPGLMPDDTFGLDLDSPRIKELASNIAGSIEDPWGKALAIGRWVHENLGKSMRECLSALKVLEVGEGECQSHSLLAVSLCRAAGLPARFAYGVVYLPDKGTYGYHTWVEVNVGDWIPIDPTLGNFPAGVDHITLAVGGYQDQFRLLPYIMGKGGWRIEFREQQQSQISSTVANATRTAMVDRNLRSQRDDRGCVTRDL